MNANLRFEDKVWALLKCLSVSAVRHDLKKEVRVFYELHWCRYRVKILKLVTESDVGNQGFESLTFCRFLVSKLHEFMVVLDPTVVSILKVLRIDLRRMLTLKLCLLTLLFSELSPIKHILVILAVCICTQVELLGKAWVIERLLWLLFFEVLVKHVLVVNKVVLQTKFTLEWVLWLESKHCRAFPQVLSLHVYEDLWKIWAGCCKCI